MQTETTCPQYKTYVYLPFLDLFKITERAFIIQQYTVLTTQYHEIIKVYLTVVHSFFYYIHGTSILVIYYHTVHNT